MDIGSEAIDGFTVNWQIENNYICSPIYLIPRVLSHARSCNCVGSTVVPEWPQLFSGLSFVISLGVLLNLSNIGFTCHWLQGCS